MRLFKRGNLSGYNLLIDFPYLDVVYLYSEFFKN
jgi:hypothetical protein